MGFVNRFQGQERRRFELYCLYTLSHSYTLFLHIMLYICGGSAGEREQVYAPALETRLSLFRRLIIPQLNITPPILILLTFCY